MATGVGNVSTHFPCHPFGNVPFINVRPSLRNSRTIISGQIYVPPALPSKLNFLLIQYAMIVNDSVHARALCLGLEGDGQWTSP